MQVILVTGGAGFIGSNFIHYLIQNTDYSVINFDALTYAGNLQNLKKISQNKHYKFLKGDITYLVDIKKIKEMNFDFIVNFAAESHVDRSIDSPNQFIQTNIVGTQNLLNLALERNITKFIQISTDEVYGSLGSTGYFTETSHLNPSSPYAASKASADLITLVYHKTYGLPVVITRCSNNYGPYQFPEKLIPLMINNVLKNKFLPVYGDGKNVRDWIYVEDHCEGILSVLEKGIVGEIYNLGGNSEKENIEIVELLLEKLNKPKSLIKYVKDRKAHDRRYAIDFSKIKKELGWEPKTTLKMGLEKTINWYLNNREWLDEIITGEYVNYYQKMYGKLL